MKSKNIISIIIIFIMTFLFESCEPKVNNKLLCIEDFHNSKYYSESEFKQILLNKYYYCNDNYTTYNLHILNNPFNLNKADEIIIILNDYIVYSGKYSKVIKNKVKIPNIIFNIELRPWVYCSKNKKYFNIIQPKTHLLYIEKNKKRNIYLVFCPYNDYLSFAYLFGTNISLQ